MMTAAASHLVETPNAFAEVIWREIGGRWTKKTGTPPREP